MRQITLLMVHAIIERFTTWIFRRFVGSARFPADRVAQCMIMWLFILGHARQCSFSFTQDGWKTTMKTKKPLIYAVSTVETIVQANLGYIFSDGHGIAAFTQWYDRLSDLDKVDWDMVYANYWADTVDDMDRQRRKQAEFLVHRFCPWDSVKMIGVLNKSIKEKVKRIFEQKNISVPVKIRRQWYY
jgi:hypothetical protein